MPRFFLPPDAWAGRARLEGEEARHCARVMRAKPGDRITVFDGEGRRAEAEVTAVSARSVELELGETRLSTRRGPSIGIVVAVLKGKAMDWLVQKAVELGADSIETVVTARAVVRPGEGKEEKWQRVALEACKQCGRDRVPHIPPPRLLEDWIAEVRTDGGGSEGGVLVASLSGAPEPLPRVLDELGEHHRMRILIGPEGDFTAAEDRLCRESGCRPVSLGDEILRAETAGIFAISALRCWKLRDF